MGLVGALRIVYKWQCLCPLVKIQTKMVTPIAIFPKSKIIFLKLPIV